MDQGHRRAPLGEAISGLQPQQSAADHDDALLAGGERQQQIDVPAVAKGVHTGEIGAGNVEPQRRRAGGKNKFGKRDALFIGDLQFPPADIDLGSDAAIFQGNAAVAPPLCGLELDVMRGGLGMTALALAPDTICIELPDLTVILQVGREKRRQPPLQDRGRDSGRALRGECRAPRQGAIGVAKISGHGADKNRALAK